LLTDAPPHDIEGERAALPEIVVPRETSAPANGLGCNSNIEVVCIYCGTVSGEPLTRFTISHIWAMDQELARHLARWPNFRKVIESDDEAFANQCPHCGAGQDDMYLHSEPDEPFFDIPGAAPGSISLTPLSGTVRLSGVPNPLAAPFRALSRKHSRRGARRRGSQGLFATTFPFSQM
jgi:hypothetical protein